MGYSANSVSEVILVLCHSFFHDAFRPQRPVDEQKFRTWMSSRFVANLIIERKAELPEGSDFAITSKQAFEDFAVKFYSENPSPKQKEIVDILHNSVFVLDHASISKLSIDESILVICDTLYSRSNYAPILITNIPKKREKAEEFYHKKDPFATIPYPIYSAEEAELFLHGRYPELSALVDERTRISGY